MQRLSTQTREEEEEEENKKQQRKNINQQRNGVNALQYITAILCA